MKKTTKLSTWPDWLVSLRFRWLDVKWCLMSWILTGEVTGSISQQTFNLLQCPWQIFIQIPLESFCWQNHNVSSICFIFEKVISSSLFFFIRLIFFFLEQVHCDFNFYFNIDNPSHMWRWPPRYSLNILCFLFSITI